MSATFITPRIQAPRAKVYAALLDPAAIAAWKVPDQMTCTVEAFDARVGGDFCITLAYDLPTGNGKTTPERDTYQGRFLELVPNERVVELHTFVTDDAALQGQMTVTFTLEDAGTGTFLSAIHDGLPPGLSPEDNEVGWAMALRKLAAYLESPAAPSALR